VPGGSCWFGRAGVADSAMVVMASEAERHRLSQTPNTSGQRAHRLEPCPPAPRHSSREGKKEGPSRRRRRGKSRRKWGCETRGGSTMGKASQVASDGRLQDCGGSSRAPANGSVAGRPLGPAAVLPSGRREDGASLVRVSVPFPTSTPPVPCAERRGGMFPPSRNPAHVMLGEVGLAVRHPLSSLLTP
jgi:hypothetical protein